ncbi:MAG: isoprenylcysteine carboxylmethyltransferase family protein [Phycisphaerales bacterium]|nr:isoprenylcysteine carboxylmethyltransferase family protein [Phycisphaerales bacterium]MCB9855421.1 isoprenylcysteine carboxylmethyltransferase family protein [Phycisphaerales bacterium]
MEIRRTRYLMLGVIFKVRGLLMVPPLAYALLHFDGRYEESVGWWGVGLVLFFCGAYLRVAAQRHLRYRLKSRKQLATTGPFRLVRNPVYWANMSILAGLAFMAEIPWMAPVLVIWAFLVYDLSIRFEEMRLMKRFGAEYAQYMAETPRWIPRLSGRIAGSSQRGTRWWPAIAVELHCMLLIVFPIAKEVFEHRLGGWRF